METLNTHMKSVHDESDHMRIIRLTESFEAAIKQQQIGKTEDFTQINAKSLDCTECGVIFLTLKEQEIHIEQHPTKQEIYKEDIKEENTCKENDDKEDGEVDPEVVIVEQGAVPYKMGCWGGEEKEYSFGGKRKDFAQATLEIKRLFFTNKEYEISGIKLALVSKNKDEKGTGQNFLISVEKTGEKGKAMLKTWDKNTKKEYKMVVLKAKESDLKYVRMLAGVIKILLDKNISGEGWSEMKSVNKVKCETCGKLFSSERYMKTHATRMHKEGESIVPGVNTCIICNKKFTTEWNLKSHVIICKKQTEIFKKEETHNSF